MSQRWKVTGKAALICLMAAFLIFAVTAGVQAKPAKTTIKIWHAIPQNQRELFNRLANDYIASTSGMVEFEATPFKSQEELINKLLEAKEKPDVALIDCQWLDTVRAKQPIECMEDIILNKMGNTVYVTFKSDTFAPMWEASKSDGKLYAIPFYAYNRALIVNRDILNKYGVKKNPKTWNDVVEIGKQISLANSSKPPGNPEHWGFYIPMEEDGYSTAEFIRVMLWQSGKDITEPFMDGTLSSFENSENKAVVNMFVDMINNTKIAPSSSLSKERSAMFIGTPQDYLELKNSGKNVEVFPWPSKTKSKNDISVFSFVIFKTPDSAKQEKIWHMLYTLCEFKSGLKLGITTPFLPPDKQVTLSPDYFDYLQKNPGIRTFLQQMANSKVSEMDENTVKIMRNFDGNLKKALLKKGTIEDNLKESAKYADILLDPKGELRGRKELVREIDTFITKLWDKDYTP
ncbi:MAG: extracellular solute-binding protein [Firmicutes bacterium]|nr:extracellular solute-binding protein [Bacillota bacterium]